jgi:molecular chaperone DnaK
MAAAQKIGEKLNQQAQPGAQQEAPKSQKKDDDVVDADFKEV